LSQRGRWALAASLAALVVGAVATWKLSTPSSEPESVVYTAPADRHRTVHLNDGSELALAADAVVAVSFTEALRAVALERGQTYFEVEKDAGRPFVVHAGEVRVTAVGTAFNVVRSEQAVTVTVTEGAVEVARIVVGNEIATPVRVSMGERKIIAFSGPTEGDVRATTPVAGTGWRNGRVEFTGATLADVLPLVNEYAPRTLVIDDPRVADLVYSGTILQQHVGEWIDSLPRIFPVRQVALADGTTTLVMDSDQR
jgi:transmembrane sensor